MNKTDVTKVLAQGSPRQRALILAEDIAQYRLFHKGFLTDKEHQALTDSFKTPAEIRLYNKFRECDKTIINAMPYLKQLQLIHEVSIAYLTGYSILWRSYQREAGSYEQILYLIKDKATKKEVIKVLTGGLYEPMLGSIVLAKDRDIDIVVKDRPPKKDRKTKAEKKRVGLGEIIDAYTEKATEQLKEAKALAQAILEYIDEEGFNVKTYKTAITDIMDALSTDRAVMPIFSRKVIPELKLPEESEERYKETMSKYWVFPDPDIEPDPERVKYYKDEYLKD